MSHDAREITELVLDGFRPGEYTLRERFPKKPHETWWEKGLQRTPDIKFLRGATKNKMVSQIYSNVYCSGPQGRWYWQFCHKGRRYRQGGYDTEHDAARGHNEFVLTWGIERALLEVVE